MPKIEIAVDYRDGRRETFRVGRPADLIAFADKFNKVAPEGPNVMREAAWLAHRAAGIAEPLEAWVEELDDLEVKAVQENGAEPGPTQPPSTPDETSPA